MTTTHEMRDAVQGAKLITLFFAGQPKSIESRMFPEPGVTVTVIDAPPAAMKHLIEWSQSPSARKGYPGVQFKFNNIFTDTLLHAVREYVAVNFDSEHDEKVELENQILSGEFINASDFWNKYDNNTGECK